MLPIHEMLPLLDNLMQMKYAQTEQTKKLVEVKQRVFINVGLDTAYCKETHSDVEHFLRILERNLVIRNSAKVLLFCGTTLNVKDILGPNIFGQSCVVNYLGESSKSPSDSNVRDTGRTSGLDASKTFFK